MPGCSGVCTSIHERWMQRMQTVTTRCPATSALTPLAVGDVVSSLSVQFSIASGFGRNAVLLCSIQSGLGEAYGTSQMFP